MGGERPDKVESTSKDTSSGGLNTLDVLDKDFFSKKLNEVKDDTEKKDAAVETEKKDETAEKPAEKVAVQPHESDQGWKALPEQGKGREAIQAAIGEPLQKIKAAADDVKASQAGIFKDTPGTLTIDGKETPATDRTVQGSFKDASGADKTGTFTQKFGQDGSVDLGLPEGHALRDKHNVSSIKFKADGTIDSVKGKDGQPRELKPEEKTALEAALKEPGALEISGKGEKGTDWKYDLKSGETKVANNIPEGSSLSLYGPNKGIDLSADVPSKGDKAGFTLQGSGDRRLLDFKDDAKKPTDDQGNTIEGLQWDKDRDVLANTTKDANIATRTLNADGSIHTTFKDDPNGRLEEVSKSDAGGSKTLTKYNPEVNKEGLVEKYVEVQKGDVSGRIERATRKLPDGNPDGYKFEFTEKVQGQDKAATARTFYKDEAALKAGDFARVTNFPDGRVETVLPKSVQESTGVHRLEYAAGNPVPKMFGPPSEGKPKGEEITDNDKATKFARTPEKPPEVAMYADANRKVYPDGSIEGKTAGGTRTEYPDRAETKFDKPLNTKELTEPVAGLQPTDARLDGVGKVTETKGPNGTTEVRLDYTPPKENGKSFEVITRDASGKEIATNSDGKDPEKGPYLERMDMTTTPPTKTRSYESGNVEMTRGDEKIFTKTVEKNGDKTVTKLHDHVAHTIEIREGDKYRLIDDRPGADGQEKVLASGTYSEFAEGPSKGRRLIDDATGKVMGLEFTDGPRKGESYTFSRDANGDVTRMEMNVPGKDGAQRVTVQRNEDGSWSTNPPGGEIPGFKIPQEFKNPDGSIKGSFRVATNGDITYESPDKSIMQVRRANGNMDRFDMRDYSRVRETPDGQSKTQYWDGYNWRDGQKAPDGKTVVFTDGAQNAPVSMTRDGETFQTNFKDRQYTVPNNWKTGELILNKGAAQQDGSFKRQEGTEEKYYASGVTKRIDVNGQQKDVMDWRKGTMSQTADGKMLITYNDPADAADIQAGKLPATAEIDPKTGQITSTFADGKSISSDTTGKYQRFNHGNGRSTEMLYDQDGNLRGYKQHPSGTEILMGKDVRGEGDTRLTEYTIRTKGQPDRKIVGTLKPGDKGAFEVTDGKGNSFRSEVNGREVEMVDGKMTRALDARGQEWKLNPPAKEGDKPFYTVDGKPLPPHMGDKPPKLFDNGNIAVQTAEGEWKTINSDKSESTLNAEGQEIARKFEDGSSYKRRPDGTLSETIDKDGNKTTFEQVDLKDEKGEPVKDDKGNVIKVVNADRFDAQGNRIGADRVVLETVNGQKVARMYSMKLDANKNPTSEPINKNSISYDQVSGARRELNEGDKQVTVQDLHGNKRILQFEDLNHASPKLVLDGNDPKKVLGTGDGQKNEYTLPDGKKARLNPNTGALEPIDATASDTLARTAREKLDPAVTGKQAELKEAPPTDKAPEGTDKPTEVKAGTLEEDLKKPEMKMMLDMLGIPEAERLEALKTLETLGMSRELFLKLGQQAMKIDALTPKPDPNTSFKAELQKLFPEMVKASLAGPDPKETAPDKIAESIAKKQKQIEDMYNATVGEPKKTFDQLTPSDLVKMAGKVSAANEQIATAMKDGYFKPLNDRMAELVRTLESDNPSIAIKDRVDQTKPDGPKKDMVLTHQFYALIQKYMEAAKKEEK